MTIQRTILLALSMVLPIPAAPTVGSLNASPGSVRLGVSTPVIMTVQITGGAVEPGGVNLLQESATGSALGVLGVMHDDGKNGDVLAGDGIYTLLVPFNPSQLGSIWLQASAAFQGVLQRVKSPVFALPVVSQSGRPSLSDFNPKSGPVGTLVSVGLLNFSDVANGNPQVSVPGLNGNAITVSASTLSTNSLSFVIPAGAASGKLTVTLGSQTATSTITFAVTTSATFNITVGPATATLLQGQTVTYAVTAKSPNGFDGLATLAVAGLPSGVQAVFKPAQITAGQLSNLTLSAPGSQGLSTSTLTITASASIDGQTVSQSATALLKISGQSTAFLGRTVVDDNAETPIAGVTVRLLGQDGSLHTTTCSGQTTSDAAGNFAFTNLPTGCTGPQLIGYDGTTATSPSGKYAGVNLVYKLVPGQVTTSPVLIHLPRIDDKETVMIKQNSPTDQVFKFQSMPNLLLTVYAGTIFTLEDGSHPDPFPLVAINVPVDRLPDKMPSVAMVTPFIVAFQPANAYSNQPVAIDYPNLLNVAPASNGTLMTLDPTRGFMVPYGTGTVSADGLRVIADSDPAHPGHHYGLVHFDWHTTSFYAALLDILGICPECEPPPPGTCPIACAATPNPIDLASGIEVLTNIDLMITNARSTLSLVRTYRTLNSNRGPFGWGTGHNYFYRLDTSTPDRVDLINLFFPDGSSFAFARVNGTNQFVNNTIPMFVGAIMTANADRSTDIRWKDGTVYHFTPTVNGASFLGQIRDTNGNFTTMTWSGFQMLQVADAVGRSLTFTYDGSNRITSVVDPIGRAVQYAYNTQGTLEAVTDPAGGVTRYEYDADYRVTKITNARNVVTVQNFYDGNGRVIRQIQADEGVTRFFYTTQDADNVKSPNLETVMIDPRGNATTYRFDAVGFLQSVTDASGQSRVFGRIPGTNLIASITGGGSCDACEYPQQGDLTFSYDANGNRTGVTEALGNRTSYTYDPVFNKITDVTDPAGNHKGLAYDAHGSLTSVTDPNQNTTSFTYDSFGELIQTKDALNNQTSFSYDFGNLVAVTDPLQNKTQIAYDDASRPTQITDPLGMSTTLVYDNLDRVVKQTDARNGVTQFAYDKVGNLLSVTDAKGNPTSFAYDAMDRLSTRTDPLLHSDSRSYDFNSDLIKFVDRRGQTSQFTYDVLNRLSTEAYEDGSSVARKYDANSRVSVIADSLSGPSDFSYDVAGRLLSTANRIGAVQYAYDRDSRLASREVVGQPAVQYAYDRAGNLLSAAMPNLSASFDYDSNNRLSMIRRLNGVTSKYQYDAGGRLLSILHSGGAGINVSLNYAYDAHGNPISYSTPIGQPLTTKAATSTYNAANQLISRTDASGAISYSFDRNGNLQSSMDASGMTRYAWDARSRLASIDQSNGQSSLFQYDWATNLLQQTDKGPTSNLTQQFLLDFNTNLAQVTRSNGDSLEILMGIGIDQDLATLNANGQAEYSLKDQINSTVLTADAGGAKASTIQYEPFGETSSSSRYPAQFTGRTPIASGLYYYRARFYNSQIGRFVSEDPIGFRGGPNLYSYVLDKPTGFEDPHGLAAQNDTFQGCFDECTERPAAVTLACDAIGAAALCTPVLPPVTRVPIAVGGAVCGVGIAVSDALCAVGCGFQYSPTQWSIQPTSSSTGPPYTGPVISGGNGTIAGQQ